MKIVILLVAGLVCLIVWLGLLLVTGFNGIVLGTGLLALLGLMGRST
jgi:hypothetical protein